MKKFSYIVWILVLTLGSIFTPVFAEEDTIKIFFTSNLKDHIESQREIVEEETVWRGGYSYLSSALKQNKGENDIVVDAGNFSTGTIFNSIYTTKGPDLSLLGIMGYDAVNLGVEDFDYGAEALASMIENAEATPTIVTSNIKYAGPQGNYLKEVMVAKEASEYKIIEKEAITYGIFGLLEKVEGKDNLNPYVYDEPLVENTIQTIQEANPKIIICLWSGSFAGAKALAEVHEEIDIIISSHHRDTIKDFTKVGDTIITSIPENGLNLGYVELDKQGNILKIDKIPINATEYESDEDIDKRIKEYRSEVTNTILKRYGITYQTNYVSSPFALESLDKKNQTLTNASIADLVTDSFVSSYVRREDDNKIVLSVTARGMITGGLNEGYSSISDLYSVVNQGIGEDELVGRSLLRVYVSGKDIRHLCELDCTYLSDYPERQLYFGSLKYDYNYNREKWNYVEEVYVEGTKDYFVPIKDKQMYPLILNTELYEQLPKWFEESGSGLSFKCSIVIM